MDRMRPLRTMVAPLVRAGARSRRRARFDVGRRRRRRRPSRKRRRGIRRTRRLEAVAGHSGRFADGVRRGARVRALPVPGVPGKGPRVPTPAARRLFARVADVRRRGGARGGGQGRAQPTVSSIGRPTRGRRRRRRRRGRLRSRTRGRRCGRGRRGRGRRGRDPKGETFARRRAQTRGQVRPRRREVRGPASSPASSTGARRGQTNRAVVRAREA